ncbi:Kinesin-like protein KIN-14J [Heracleum sosnowskyi]|uniref:Kinesin-like protein KIN-14J n=1 Tax=Heracleum sosnowskyi TaxID=360622 RepID=A0AAD8GS46_9APIA|nr:Kinesin-like protein KIN-14J [Heracleum sosnowskyi]
MFEAQNHRKDLPGQIYLSTLHDVDDHASNNLRGPLTNTLNTGNKSRDLSKLMDGYFADASATEISDFLKLNSIENASTRSLFSVAKKILDENIERKNGDIPNRVASLLKVVVQEMDQRFFRQNEDLRKQKSTYKSREEKLRTKIRVLETLATGTTEENEVVLNQLQKTKIEMMEIEEKKKLEEEDIIRLLKQKESSDSQIITLKEELDLTKRTYEKHCFLLETQAKEAKVELQNKIVELECLLADSRKKVEEHQALTQSKYRRWKRKELGYKSFLDFNSGSLQDLRMLCNSLKQEILQIQNFHMEEINHLGLKLTSLVEAAQNYHAVLEENRKLYNEVQDLKGNIRVYCRIRPFLSGQSRKQTTIEYMGENGDLVVKNPSKQGKASHRLFKFNKVFGPAASQEEVFLDTQQLIRSVLDGYNVCIFAYGQTGSGKTYTMTGPTLSSKVDWGVNYRALNDLFHLSQSRKSSITYDVSVQMVEIYNEQVRDLLTGNNQQKNLGIWNSTQPNGLAVPDASMHPVKSTSDVLELMNIGLLNRAVGATALNERSSRSHSVLSVHVRGMDLKTNTILRGNLHLVDLAGSERVDRSEATGDRLREAQHINKSLSALGDVIFALAQKSPHVPYRNSKLTQVLQSSLGGQAKTLMFVQLNPDVESYSETISTLKFAERVSGVELGAAQSNKEGRGVRELMEQVALLKDAVARKDEEISLLLAKPNLSAEKHALGLPKYGSSSPRRHSIGTPRSSRRISVGKSPKVVGKAASDMDKSSEYSDKHSEADSPLSDGFRHHKEFFQQSRPAAVDATLGLTEEVVSRLPSVHKGHNITDEFELLGFEDADSEERLSDISDGVLSMATETEGSVASIVEYTLFPETSVLPSEVIAESTVPPAEILAESTKPPAEKSSVSARVPRPEKKPSQGSSRMSSARSSTKVLPSSKKAATGSSSLVKSNSTSSLLKSSRRRL